MVYLRLLGMSILLFAVPWAMAQEATAQPKEKASETAKESAEAPAEKAGSPYAGDWTTWPKMTGDWGGLRTDLAEKGITLDIDVTNILQENWHGGADTTNAIRYSGSADITITLDTGKMGLWKGGTIVLVGEPKWGNGINGKAGSLIPVNFDAAIPTDEECTMTLSEWFIQQVLFEGKVVLIAGKLFGARAFDKNVFANDERTQFMNVGLRNTPMIPSFLPYTTLGAGVVLNLTDWMSVLTAVADTDGRSDTWGWDTAFHGEENVTVIHEWDFKVNPFDQPGNQRVGFVWSSKDFESVSPITPFKQTGPLLIDLLGMKTVNKIMPFLPKEEHGDNIMVYYNFDQYLYTEEEDPTQGIGIFGRFGWARQDVNPVAHFYSIGMGGKGVIPERDNDTFGVGYFFMDLSNDLPRQLHSEQGVECFYNIEITPWMHLSPDLQVIVNPGGTDANDVAVVGGLRLQMNL